MLYSDPAAVTIVPHEMMRGADFAVQEGDATEGRTIYVSPAIYDQIKNADEQELDRLLKRIPLKRIPVLSQFDMYLQTIPHDRHNFRELSCNFPVIF